MEKIFVLCNPHIIPGSPFCANCKFSGHQLANCLTIECRYYHRLGYILDIFRTRPSRSPGQSMRTRNFSKSRSSSVAAATPASTAFSDLHDIFKQVRDPQTRQTIGTGHKIGRLFELTSLKLPVSPSIYASVTDSLSYQWHLRSVVLPLKNFAP